MQFTRRTFIRTTATCGLAAGAGPLLYRIASGIAAEKSPATVAAVTGPRPAAVRRAVELLGGMEKFVKKDSRVVLKPNMSWAQPIAAAVNTHPEVVAAVATLCVEAGAREVLILDHTINVPETCIQMSGIRDACRGIQNVRVFAVNHKRLYDTVPVPRGQVLRSVELVRDVLRCDTFINLPCAKSHTTTGVTLGMKNLMGVIWNRRAFHSDFDINQGIADLTSAVKIALTVVDASRALTTGGPAGPGRVIEPNTIIAGVDPVAVDAVSVGVADWYGQQFTPEQVKHIVAAQNMGLGTMELDRIEIKRAAA